MSGMKNTKKDSADIVTIERNLLEKLERLNLNQYPKHYFYMAKGETVAGEESIAPKKVYDMFCKARKALGFEGKGYTLYSFKHYSNIQRFNSGEWSLTEIMVANRHSDVEQTLTYLKDITRTTDITDKEVPPPF